MKYFTATTLLFFTITSMALAQAQQVEELSNGNFLIENFENEQVGMLPQQWFNQKADKPVPTFTNDLRDTYEYKIMEEDGNKFLRFNGVNGKHLNFPTKEVKNIDLDDTPILSWKWRILEVPEDADDEDNDTAASIYVFFDVGRVLFKKVPKTIRYTWSSNIEKGAEYSKFFGNQQTVVVGTGNTSGGWQTFERNIAEDIKDLFGDDVPRTPIAILILSDGDDTGETVIADYDDIMLKPSQNE